MEVIIFGLIFDIIYIGYKLRKGRDLSYTVMCAEKCDYKSCNWCDDREQCCRSRGEEYEINDAHIKK